MNKYCLSYTFSSFLFVFFSALLISCEGNKKTVNDWDRMNLKGYVKQIDEARYPSYQDYSKKVNAKKNFTRFTTDGLILKNAQFLFPGQIHWMKYRYSNDSVWIRELREIDNKSEHPQSYWLYKIDEQGLQKSVTSILLDSSINFHIDMKYNDKGLPIEINYAQKKYPTHVPCKVIKIYDEQGYVKEEYTYVYNQITSKCQEKPNRSVFKVNEHGDIEREIIYNSSDVRIATHSYKYRYNEEGNWIEKLHYNGDYPEEVIERAYIYHHPDSMEHVGK